MKSSVAPVLAITLAYIGMRVSSDVGQSWFVAWVVSLVGCAWFVLSINGLPRRSATPWSIIPTALALSCLMTLYLLHGPVLFERLSDAWLAKLWPEQQAPRQWLETSSRIATAPSGNWLWNEHSIRPLPRRTNLKPGNQPEVFVQLDRSADAATLLRKRVYLSAFALGHYDHAAWAMTPATDPSPTFPSRPGTMISYEVFHPSDPSGQTPLIALQGLIDTTMTATIMRGDGIRMLPAQPSALGYRYRATSQPLHLDDLPDFARTADAHHLPRNDLALPNDPAFLLTLREKILSRCGDGSIKQRLLRMRAILQSEYQYSLVIDNPHNHDPLINFLCHEKRGHCEMFATAAAMAARAMGIPSRIAYGWAGGSYFDSSQLFVFRAREAHAWAEVWFDDVGWVILDATPPLAVGRSRAAPPEEKPLTAEEMAAPQDLAYGSSSTPLWISWALMAIACCGGALHLWLRPRTHPMSSPHHRGSGKTSDSDYEPPLLAWCHFHGVYPPDHWTLRDIMAALPTPPACAEELCQYHYATRYGNQPRNRSRERQLRKLLQQEMANLQRGASHQRRSLAESNKNGIAPFK